MKALNIGMNVSFPSIIQGAMLRKDYSVGQGQKEEDQRKGYLEEMERDKDNSSSNVDDSKWLISG